MKIKNYCGIELLLERCKEIKVFIYGLNGPTNLRIPESALRGTYTKLDVLILTGLFIAHFADFLQLNPQLKAIIDKSGEIRNIENILLTVNKLPFAAIVLLKHSRIENALKKC